MRISDWSSYVCSSDLEGGAGDTVVFRAGGQVDTQRGFLEMVVLDGIEQRVVDEQRLALTTADHAVATGIATLHVADEVAGDGRIGDVVHQDAVVLILLGAGPRDDQLAALHQRVTGAGKAGGCVASSVVVWVNLRVT